MRQMQRKEHKRSLLILFLPLVLIVCIFIALVVGRISNVKDCTRSLTATLVSYRMVEVWDVAQRHYEHIPTVRYQVDGIWYQGEPMQGAPSHLKKEGEPIEIMYNPQNPQEYYVPDDSEFFLLVGTVVVISVYTFVSIVRKDKRSLHNK